MITLERQCFGCAGASVLTLRSDGQAKLIISGNARQGTQDQVTIGRVRREDFDALSALIVANGFFAMADSYEDPDLRDGASVTISVARGGSNAENTPPKRVFRREEAGPEALKAVETAIENLRSRIPFQPERP